jgi:hypothetical protein
MLQRIVGSVIWSVLGSAKMWITGRGLVGLKWQLVKLITGRVSVHEVKVRLVSVPVMLVALLFAPTSASKDDWAQVNDPTPGNVRVVGSDVVLVIVVEPVRRPPPGSVRSATEANADAAPMARRPSTDVVASRVRFRTSIIPFLVSRCRRLSAHVVCAVRNSHSAYQEKYG